MSFKNIGLLDELKLSTKYVPKYVLEQRFKKEATQIAKQKEKIEIAKELKRRGTLNKDISGITGLPIEEVEKLKVRKK